MSDFSETCIQEGLRAWLRGKGHEFITPNVGLWNWESDLVGLTQAGYAYEYEIKCTRSDFRRDFNKDRHETLAETKRGPARFAFVAPAGVIQEAELPKYAGLLVVGWREQRHGPRALTVKELVAPPRRHERVLSRKRLRYLGRGLGCRYWELRRGTAE